MTHYLLKRVLHYIHTLISVKGVEDVEYYGNFGRKTIF